MKTKSVVPFLAYFILATVFVNIGCAQNSIPNGNFESWNSTTYESPTNYLSSNGDALSHCGSANVVKSTDAYTGSYAVKLTTTSCGGGNAFSYILNAQPNNNFPNWPGGFPYNQTPTGIQGYYKSNIPSPDTSRLILIFKKNGAPIGSYIYSFYGTHNTYTPFNFTLSPALSVTPDTVIFGAVSSDFANEALSRTGSMLLLDNVSFTGVTSQPALFNGDFENWTNNTFYTPTDWAYFSSEERFTRTTDRAAGNYAAQLVTALGDRNGNPAANSSYVGNGDWINGCQCWIGGNSFSKATDTLAFYYKYDPMSNDSAEVLIMFKSNGNQIGGNVKRLGKTAGSGYQYMEVPFSLGMTPDTAIVRFHSSKWEDSSTVYVGSTLKIDEVHFKSQPLITSILPAQTIQTAIYPNPFSNQAILRVDFPLQNAHLTIENNMGQVVKELHDLSGNLVIINRDNLPQGLYFVRLINNGSSISVGKILITD
ncbi:MAG: T9SS type A sorting domain-containing protein [Bacteroidia bacterium]|nr:T9SS type A sorting domain-containing protein [Bacteroidia bacterium]